MKKKNAPHTKYKYLIRSTVECLFTCLNEKKLVWTIYPPCGAMRGGTNSLKNAVIPNIKKGTQRDIFRD